MKKNGDLISRLLLRELNYLPPSIKLPANFDGENPPRFKYGDKLRWISVEEEADWGIVIGKFYNYEPHQRCWMWCYLICLSPNSKSAAWCQFDTAWEEDLEKFDNEKAPDFDR